MKKQFKVRVTGTIYLETIVDAANENDAMKKAEAELVSKYPDIEDIEGWIKN